MNGAAEEAAYPGEGGEVTGVQDKKMGNRKQFPWPSGSIGVMPKDATLQIDSIVATAAELP